MEFTHRFDPTTLREYHIRGTVGRTLSEADAFAIGRCFGTLVSRRGGRTVAVGYDGRLSSPALEAALVDGLMRSGMEAIRIGRGPTPMLYYTGTKLATDGAVMVTGSHNPPEYNGFKMVLGGKPFFGTDIRDLGAMAAAGDVVAETQGSDRRIDIAQESARCFATRGFVFIWTRESRVVCTSMELCLFADPGPLASPPPRQNSQARRRGSRAESARSRPRTAPRA